MIAWRRWWRDMGLATRLVGVTLLLLLLVQAAVFVFVRFTITEQARARVDDELEVGERVWLRLLDNNAERLRQAASLLASDFGFRAAVNSGDTATIESALENSGQRIGATVTALFDPGLQLSAASAGNDRAAGKREALQDLVRQVAAHPQKKQLALVGQTPYQFVMVPMRAPAIIGWVLMGFPIDQALADDMYRLFSVHLAVIATPQGQPGSVVVTTLGMPDIQTLARVQEAKARLSLLGETYGVRNVSHDAARGGVRTALLRSYDEVLKPFRRLQLVLGLITLAGLALFAAGSWAATRRVTQPLRALLGVTQALERGQYDVAIADTDRGDEVGQLAHGFDVMRQSISAQQAEIRRLAYWDRLTGLPNRARFRDVVRETMTASQPTGKPLAVITLNLDRFKHVNDVLGYAFGDELLKAVAGRLQQQVFREGDLVARLGGDEFCVLLSRTDAQGAMAMCRRITHAFEEPLAFDEQTVDVSASMGVACWPDDGKDADTLMSRSEIAMHAAKTRTAGILLYAPSLDSSSAQTLSLLTDLRLALQERQLRIFLQPKIDVATRRVVAAEALVRWQHPERGLVPPLEFIPFAEQTGFVRQLTLWLFAEAAREWAPLQRPGNPIRLAMNLSTRDLLDQDFPTRVAALLAEHGAPTSGFCLEITESAIMDDPLRAEGTLNRLAEQGFKLSIDDFGTGYSSLAYLKRLPVNELKIDKSFVMGMDQNDSDSKIVRSTVDLAHNLGLSVVAEGVENEGILDKLLELRCDEAQGYHMSKPIPLEGFLAWCRQWEASQGIAVVEPASTAPLAAAA